MCAVPPTRHQKVSMTAGSQGRTLGIKVDTLLTKKSSYGRVLREGTSLAVLRYPACLA